MSHFARREPVPVESRSWAIALAAGAGLALSALGSTAHAQTSCHQFFAGGQAPKVAALPAGQNRIICESGYVLQHSSAWHEPIWSAEHLLGFEVPLEETDRRPLHAEASLPSDERAELTDYQADQKRFGRCPAAPVADFLDDTLREDAVTLANAMPLNKALDEHGWSSIERRVRDEARAAGEVYIVTGPMVAEHAPTIGRVAIPTAAWKAIYAPRTGLAGAFWVSNETGAEWQFITLAELTKRTGVDPFPSLTDELKAQAFPAPALQTAEAETSTEGVIASVRRGRR
jgi:endonuclease G